MGEEKNNNVHCWETRTGELHRPLKSSELLVHCVSTSMASYSVQEFATIVQLGYFVDRCMFY